MTLDAGIGANSASGGYDIDNSCKFESDNVEYLTQTPSSDSNRKKFTISLWVKRCEIGSYQTLYGAQPSSGFSNENTFQFCFTPDDKLGLGLQTYWVFQTNRLFRDTSAWYHIVVRADTTQPFAHNRLRLYVNGTQDTSFSINALSSIGLNDLFGVNHTTRQQIGSLIANSWHSNNYIAEVHLTDGLSYAASEFGEFDEDSGIWKAKEYTGTYGTNGFYLDFKNSANLGEDQSGNNNDWALNNLSAADQATDTPTNNFSTWQINNYNPTVSANFSFSEGGTSPKRNSGDVHLYCVSTMAMASGKWYMEYKVRSSGDSVYFGGTPITKFASENHNGYYLGQDGGGSIGYGASAFLYYWTGANTQYTENRATGDIIGVALDKDNNKIAFSKNGTFMQGSNGVRTDPATPSTMHEVQAPPYFWAFGAYTGNVEYQTNMGGFTDMSISSAASDANGYGTFEYAPPSGYYALCTKNLAEYG